MRRSMAVANGPSYRIENPISDREKYLQVTKMPLYTCREMPLGYWMSLTNKQEFYTNNSRLRVMAEKYQLQEDINESGVSRHAGT
jgi:hypothetical protein